MRSFLLVAVLALAGCATTPPPEPMRWVRSDMTGPQLQRQGQIDNAECEAISYQNVAVPTAPTYNPYQRTQPREYEVTGQTNGYDQTLGAYSGTYNATVTEKPAASNFMASYMQGVEAGQRQREYNNAIAMRANLYEACLLRRGWTKDTGEASYTAAPAPSATVPAVAGYHPPTITRRPTRQGD